MSIAAPQELVSHAVVGSELTTKKNRKDQLLSETKKKTERGYYQESLTTLQGESQLATDKLNQVLNNFGTKIDDNSGKILVDTITDPTGKSEANLVDELKETLNILTQLSDRGYGALTEPQKEKIRKAVEKRITSNSALARDYAARTGSKTEFLDSIIKSPAFLPRLKEIANEHARTGELDTSFLDRFETKKEAEADHEAAKKKREHAESKVKRIQTELHAYEKDENGVEGDLYPKMQELRTQGTSPQEEIHGIETSIAELRGQVERLERQANQNLTTPSSERPFSIASAKEAVEVETGTVAEYAQKIRAESEKVGPNPEYLREYQERGQAALEAGNEEEAENYRRLYQEESRKIGPNERLLETWRTQQRNAQQRLQAARTNLATLEGAQPNPAAAEGTFTRVDELRRQIRDLEKQLAEKKASINDFANYKNQYEQLKQQEDEAVRELAEAVADEKKTEAQLQRAAQELQRAVNLRKGQQEAFAEKLATSFGEAGHRIIVDQMVFANGQANTLHKEFEKEAGSIAEQLLNNYLAGDRWHLQERKERRGIPGFRRTITYRPTDRVAIDNDWQKLITTGESELVVDMLKQLKNPDTGNTYQDEDLKDMMNDEETWGKMKNMAVKSLIVQRMNNGGITAEDIDNLTQRQLGQNITDAIRQRGDVKANIEKIMGEGALERHDFKSRFAQVIRDHPWLLLTLLAFPLALLAPIALPVAGGVAATGLAATGIAGTGAATVKAGTMSVDQEKLHGQG